MTAQTIGSHLRSLGTCQEAVDWAEKTAQPSVAAAWAACPRGDWLLWYAARAGVSRSALVRAAAACARLALPFAGRSAPVALAAIETAEAWGERPTPENAMAAWEAASAAKAVWMAEQAATSATVAAEQAAMAAWATSEAEAVVQAEMAVSGASERAVMRRRCADAVRACIPCPGEPP